MTDIPLSRLRFHHRVLSQMEAARRQWAPLNISIVLSNSAMPNSAMPNSSMAFVMIQIRSGSDDPSSHSSITKWRASDQLLPVLDLEDDRREGVGLCVEYLPTSMM